MKVLVTGGSSGIGKEITLFLLKNGYEVLFTYFKGEESAEQICDQYQLAEKYKIDFTQADQLAPFLGEIESFDPEILINNYYHGSFINTHFHKTESTSFEREFVNNIVPTLQITQKCISIFRKKKWGRIINILSSSLRQTAMGTSVYNANKAYLLQMNKHWAAENVKFGVTCNSISPAFVLTDFHNDMHLAQKEIIMDSYPLKNLVEGCDVANFVGLCINGGVHFNGNHLFLDASNS